MPLALLVNLFGCVLAVALVVHQRVVTSMALKGAQYFGFGFLCANVAESIELPEGLNRGGMELPNDGIELSSLQLTSPFWTWARRSPSEASKVP